MRRRGRAVWLTLVLLVALLTATGCRIDPLDLPVPDPKPERPFP